MRGRRLNTNIERKEKGGGAIGGRGKSVASQASQSRREIQFSLKNGRGK